MVNSKIYLLPKFRYMRFSTKKLIKTRKKCGLTQEELAVRSNVALRTIQRIESQKSQPRASTLKLISDALEITPEELYNSSKPVNPWFIKLADIFFLIIANLTLISIIGYLTLDSEANLNSRFAAFLTSILLPYLIVIYTSKMNPVERLVKFGSGFIFYFVLLLALHGISTGFVLGFVKGLIPCILLAVLTLYYGGVLHTRLAVGKD